MAGRVERSRQTRKYTKEEKDAYRALEKCLKEGKIRAIGVSNYHVRHLEELLSYCEIKPSVNQIEAHPMWPQEDLIEFCESKGIAVVKYSPFGGGGAPLLDGVRFRERKGKKEEVEEEARNENRRPTSRTTRRGNRPKFS